MLGTKRHLILEVVVVVVALVWNHSLEATRFGQGVDAFLATAVFPKFPRGCTAPRQPQFPSMGPLFSLGDSRAPPDTRETNRAGNGSDAVEKKNRRKRSLYSFSEARKIARGHGFSTREEFIEYDCAGAYQVPKNADEVWSEDWTSWEDFLGLRLAEFEQARDVARSRVGPNSTTSWKVSTEEEYLELFRSKQIDDDDIASRLPYRPDLFYKNKGWTSWEDFLSPGSDE
ncbi:unnamed protein product [Pseudo-nitzschia multistriata]|uniref:Uncharacterized protein n=1 Tax=Pseudo-nitzschia multistriata TaxID=183589 RepID=A0A448YXH5_9STRA|nr:unnamed protein product [Pseudo-nitzschia multistriata]